jgi:hypothetical protein
MNRSTEMNTLNLDTVCCIPFDEFICELPPISSTTFTQFQDLPAELQVRIIELCDSGTLFQLMRTTSLTRKEALRIFFTQSDIYYHVPMETIYSSSETLLPTQFDFNVEFLGRVENVAIAGRLFFVTQSVRSELYDWTQTKIITFWRQF